MAKMKIGGLIARLVSWLRARRSRGQGLVEFAMALPVFILLFFGVFEFGRLMQSYVTIQHAVEEASRYATTGDRYQDGTGVREAAIVQAALDATTGLNVVSSAGSGSPGYFHVTIRSSRSGPNPMEADNAGGANDFVRIDIDYNHPVVVRIFGDTVGHIPLHATSLVLNERFARPTGVVGELPPTPVATWTNTPTPNATQTAVAGTATAVARITATAAVAQTATAGAAQTATVQAGWTPTRTPVPPTPTKTTVPPTATKTTVPSATPTPVPPTSTKTTVPTATRTPVNTPASTHAAQTATAAAKTATAAAPTPSRTPYP
jgi:hypothetical protein